ncbi:Dynamin-related protein 4C [Heracleum sosnowskyi]|uniref:Dynamin-related protein 4C n=1 Tax=Heracleum sosnowskyi TaxID=360622 RepID=A0AAD8JG73_9APIA|nr:Dynamin-related protein 4C [Heracleum sosnowskyi]
MEWIPKQRVEQVNKSKFKQIVVKSDQEHSNMSIIVCEVDESVVPLFSHAPIVSSYNEKIRPLLDAIDKLRNLKVMQEGIQLPTIVVVGDQSSGKSSVLESLAGISLPRGQGICTRVPLIMRLHHHSKPESELHLEYCGKVVSTDELKIAESINMATAEIAGDGKGISHTPLTLVVKKNGVPDLTMVDLPGITRVPVHGQPENIYEQISGIIMEYIKPEESIILNVLSATVDFPTCESIRMSQSVDKTGDRTLAVVTKSDKSPEGLRDKVMADDVNIGLGYVCVRNRIGDESYEEARMAESMLFESHPLLSKIDKSMVSVPVLARKLVQIQATIIAKCLPEIVKTINAKLHANVLELNNLPQKLSTVAEAFTAFMRILGLSRESLKKLLVRGEFDEYPDNKNMHSTARLAEMLDNFSQELKNSSPFITDEKFLIDEIFVLEETKSVALPNFLPRSAFLHLLQLKVQAISEIPVSFVGKVWDYIETVVVGILMHHCENYPPLQSSTKRAALNLIAKMKEQSTCRVLEIIEMEKLADYTCDPEYLALWNKLMKSHAKFKAAIDGNISWVADIESFGKIDLRHLDKFSGVRDVAFDLKMRLTSYWNIVLKRMVDCIALYLLMALKKLVNQGMEEEIVKEVLGPQGCGIERLMDESPSFTIKRERLNQSIGLLEESRDVLAKIIDRIAIADD